VPEQLRNSSPSMLSDPRGGYAWPDQMGSSASVAFATMTGDTSPVTAFLSRF